LNEVHDLFARCSGVQLRPISLTYE